MHLSLLLSTFFFTLSVLSSPSVRRNWDHPRALYYITNDATNAVVSLHIAEDGVINEGLTTSTGGAGLHGLNATGQVSGGDALFSEGSVTVAGSVSVLCYSNYYILD
jgi:hypothetical protein